MLSKVKNQEKGFTIIEVLIVLVIAGLIMLIVLLAVPALQRNGRNNSRKNDASRVLSATIEWKNNNNNTTPAAANLAAIQTQAGTLSYYTSIASVGAYGSGATGLDLTPAATIAFLGDNVRVITGARCRSSTMVMAGSGIVALHGLETGGGTTVVCLSS